MALGQRPTSGVIHERSDSMTKAIWAMALCLTTTALGCGDADLSSEPPAGSAEEALSQASLVAHLPLDTITPAGTTPDASGNGNDGAVVGAIPVAGRFDDALGFGTGKYVQVPNDPSLEPATLSVEAWVKADGATIRTLPYVSYVLSKGAIGCSAASYALYTGSSGGLRFYITTSSGYVLSPDAGIGIWDDHWHHVVGTYDGSSVRLYVDGAEVGAGTPTSLPIAYGLEDVTHDLYLGKYGYPCTSDFPGTIDEARLWSRALTAAETAQHASSNSPEP
jgi:hypothetical protein